MVQITTDNNSNNNSNNNNNDDNNDNNNGDTYIERRNLRFFTISSLPRELSPTQTLKWPRCNGVQITCNILSAYHVQLIVCHMVGRDGLAIKFDRV